MDAPNRGLKTVTAIRVSEWVFDLVFRDKSHQKWYTPTNGVTYTSEEKKLYESTVLRVKEETRAALFRSERGNT